MDKHAIIKLLTENHYSFTHYIKELTEPQFLFSYQQKWTAGQHMAHMILCVQPLAKVLGMDKADIANKFGLAATPGRSYDVLLNTYLERFKDGGKAADRFVPPAVLWQEKETLCATLHETVANLCAKINNLTEQDLDTLRLPHPLLDMLSIREMLFNAIYHVAHHQELVRKGLQYMPEALAS